MLKSLLTLFFTVAFSTLNSFAQDCMGVNLKAGSGFEMQNYDGKGKPSGNMIYKIKEVKKEGGLTVFSIEFESFSNKGKSEYRSTYQMRCDGNVIMVDASSLINEEQMKSLDNFQMKFTSTDIQYPNKMSVGQKLKEASMKGEGSSGPLNVTFNMFIKNREVASQEKITVPAGSYDAFKITSDMLMETKMGMGIKVEMETISWRTPDILWDLKTESYRKGKLISRTELTKIF